MYQLTQTKAVGALMAASGTGITNGGTVTSSVDRLGYDFVQLNIVLGTSDTPSDKPSVLKVQEGDTTSSYADITPLVGGSAANTSGYFTIPSADSSNPNIYRFNIDCKGRKRYLKLTLSPTTTQVGAALWLLARAKEAPIGTTAQGTLLSVYA